MELIDFGDRLRDVDQAAAEMLAVSIKERGLLNRVKLRKREDGTFKGIFGAHRFVAFQILERGEIPAIVVECTDEEARLDEIDENLYRAELSAYDQANFLEERRQIWEKIYGEVKPGRDKRKSRQLGAIEVRNEYRSYYKEVEDKFSLPKRTVQRALERKRCIIKPLWDALRGKPEAKNGALLDKIADIEVSDQARIFEEMKGRGCSVANAIALVSADTPKPMPSVVQIMKKVLDAWASWSETEQKAFLKEVRKLK
jgi:ParB family chromosome partitioning protein